MGKWLEIRAYAGFNHQRERGYASTDRDVKIGNNPVETIGLLSNRAVTVVSMSGKRNGKNRIWICEGNTI